MKTKLVAESSPCSRIEYRRTGSANSARNLARPPFPAPSATDETPSTVCASSFIAEYPDDRRCRFLRLQTIVERKRTVIGMAPPLEGILVGQAPGHDGIAPGVLEHRFQKR